MFEKFLLDDLGHHKASGKGFKLPLPALVEGRDSNGQPFQEKTTLSYISYQGSSFWLMNSVFVGSELRLIIDLPPNLSEEQSLQLIIKGRVAFVEATNGKDSKERVSLQFDSKYIIKENVS